MNNFFKLIYNELIKTYIRPSTWIMYIILGVIILGFGVMTKTVDYQADARTYGDDWREVLKAENEAILQKQAEMEKKLQEYDEKHGDNLDEFSDERWEIEMDFPDLSVVDTNNYHLSNNIKPVGFGAWQFVARNSGLLSVVSLLTIIVAAGIVAHEFRWGTIKLLLIRPISRSKILLSKYISVLLFATFTLLFVLIFAWIIGAILFGTEGPNPQMMIDIFHPVDYTFTSKLVSVYSQIISGYGYGLVNLVMMATFAFAISAIFRNSSLAIGLAIFLMMAGNLIAALFIELKPAIAKFILFTHTDLKMHADGNFWIKGVTLQFSIAVLVVYYILFLLLAWTFFVKRDVT